MNALTPASEALAVESTVLYNHVTAKLSPLDMEVVRSVPQGGNWQDIPPSVAHKSTRITQIQSSGGRTTYYGRLHPEYPSYTISTYFNRPGNGTFIHPYEHRLISLREAARLQSFPDSYRFLGSTSSMYKQIGNAVPPLLAYAIGSQIRASRTVDLFAGAGGLSLGLEMSGHGVLLASDFNQHMCRTYAHNHPNTELVIADMACEDEFQELVHTTENLLRGRTLGLVAGGPPCQGFSTAGKWDLGDPRNKLVFSFLRIIKHFLPEQVLLENVPGLMYMNKGRVLESVKDTLRLLGYAVQIFKFYSEEYGVPQMRRRIFVIGSRNGAGIQTPTAHFQRMSSGWRRNPDTHDVGPNPPLTVSDAISDLPPLVQGSGEDESVYPENPCLTTYQKLMRGKLSLEEFLGSFPKEG
jgi:DNA (cytosine-5)-methyltransferase 1